VVWLQLNLASVKPSFGQMSSDLSRAERLPDFDFSADLLDNPLQLETHLEYFNGCWRSHAALLRIPVSNAISLETNFLKIKNSTTFITVRLASHSLSMPRPNLSSWSSTATGSKASTVPDRAAGGHAALLRRSDEHLFQTDE